MTTAVDAPIPVDGAAAERKRVPSARRGPRRRLFAKYAAALVGLVSLVLLINGSLDVWFAYDKAREAAIALQHEKATAAAQRIDEFISEIERQIGWTTATQWASAPIEQRRFDFGRLQRQVPAITELIQLDNQGREQLKVSRLAMDVVGSGADYAADPRFTGVQGKKVWFGPVYFRKESEPYMTMAVAHSGRNAGVTVAEVNLKLIWDVITAIKIGKTGYAYVVDDKGRLIAHPDISRVLRNTDLSGLPQVEAARDPSVASADPAGIVRNLDGHRVLSASAAISKLGWLVFVEQPLSEALAPLFTSVLQTGLLLVLGLVVAILAGLLLARRMTGPIRALDTGAARIGAGALDHRIAVHTGDELEELAERFNTMAADLQSSYADLEKKVEDRTAELTEALDQQTATAEVLGVINSSPSDLTPVFSAILEKAHGLCGITFGTLQLYDGEKLRAVATRGFPEPLEKIIREPYAPEPNSPLLGLINGGRFVQIPDLAEHDTQVPNRRSRVAVDLGIRTLLFLPLRKENRLLGLISAARTEAKLFSEREIALLENFAAQAVIAMENGRLITETREALDQQTATAEVLGVINSSPGDLTPVFDAMLEKATRLCEAAFGLMSTYDGEQYHTVATHGVGPELAEFMRAPAHLDPESALGRIERGEDLVLFDDIADTDVYRKGDPRLRAIVDLGGARSYVMVALRKDRKLLGVIAAYRREVRPFTDKQIALLQNFAAQAVIAMENARLITETREALDQQTATAEVLGVINSSPGDLAPVFDAMLDKAMRLCEAAHGHLVTFDGEAFNRGAAAGDPRFTEWWLQQGPLRPPEGVPLARVARGEQLVHVADATSEYAYRNFPVYQNFIDYGGIRTLITVALRKEDTLLGAILVYRQEVRPFSDKQIALLQNFAAQAVIAIENARLITETREALEQQTATAEVLGVINSSPGDLAPVFDAMLEKAHRLCDATFGSMTTYDGEHFQVCALRGAPPGWAEFLKTPFRPGAGSPPGRMVAGDPLVHIPDLAAVIGSIKDPVPRAAVELGGVRTLLMVPLRRDDALLGYLTACRQEVRPFSDKQIALLQNFAAQAVIAMENARLITETREALEQQTATAEVLGVINSSPGDLAPVFDAMLEKAMRLCDAEFGLLTSFDGEAFHAAALRGVPAGFAESWREPRRPSPGLALYQLTQGENLVHVPDVTAEDAYRSGNPIRRALADLGGARTGLWVALRKDALLLGAFVIYRKEVRPFSDKQIALLQNFAAQAVIAMENARLITETREALEQQTATAEVLQVINSSPGDLTPVFDAILEKAHTLCGAAHGALAVYDGEYFRAVALHAMPEPFGELLRQPFRSSAGGSAQRRLLQGERLIHIPDVTAIEPVTPIQRASIDAGVRTLLMVPLCKDDALLGYITAHRREVRPFSDQEIVLLQNFAAQAVIAMENARLITETREALEQQTATAEVLGVINSSPGDLAPVFDAMLEKATRLCEAAAGTFWIADGEQWHAAAIRGMPDQFVRSAHAYRPSPNSPVGRIAGGQELVHITDFAAEEAYRTDDALVRAAVDQHGIRTLLSLPLRKDRRLLGIFSVYRREVRAFSDKQIALVQNFAAQAVIAMENARLITETREALEQQTATAEVLGVINSSPGDLAPVFETMLEKATSLCEAAFGVLLTWDGERFHRAAWVGAPAELIEATRAETLKPATDSLAERFVHGEGVVSIDDLVEDERYRHGAGVQALVRLGGARSYVGVALRKDDSLLGVIAIYRQEVRPFSDKQIALLQNFAAQAVIAMENARLITETREALEQQTATAEVLGVINSSPGDLAPVFDAILDKAQRVCGVDHAALELYDGERFHAVAVHGASDRFAETLRHGYRATDSPAGRALLEGRRFVQIADASQIDHVAFRTAAEVDGIRTVLFVPLRRDDALLGMIASARREARPFSEKEIALLENFAGQAVIAMENARLITELRQRTGDLQESLEYQTATSEVLKVISQSGADLEPVLEMLVETAARICEADKANIHQLRDGMFCLAASIGFTQEYKDYLADNPIPPNRGTVTGRMALERRVVHIEDVLNDPELWMAPKSLGQVRTSLAVPLFSGNAIIGSFFLARSRVERFDEKQIALVSTFADQAVIAIENARLFNELRARTAELGRSVEELKTLSEVGRAVSSTLDLRSVLSTILTSSLGLTWANAGAIFRYSRGERAFRLVEAAGWDEALRHSVGDLRLAESETAMGEAVARRTPLQLADTAQRASNPLRDLLLAAGFHSALIVPLVGAERPLGAMILMRQEMGDFPPETVRLMQTLASQSVLAIQNARMFREIADKSEQLALASQHKSQFLANMSHELRTPLNAILGYAELLVDGIYGVLPDRPKGVLERIQNNGRHLLALINDVLDLAKIEAGQLTLTLEDYSLPEVVRSVVTATEPLATGKGLKFTASLEEDMPKGHGDARRLSQVLLNLVGNAIKFTDAGGVEIRGSANRGQFVLEVSDTGPGIPDADQDRIFGEFQQIDNSNTRQKGGTGLGLAISKRMVEMQGGTIAVESALGQGSTFRVTLPVHVDEMMEAAE